MRKIALILLFCILAAPLALARPHHWMIAQAMLSDLLPRSTDTAAAPAPADTLPADTLPASPWSSALITAAQGQIGVTTIYDGSYQRLAYPGGDVPAERGVCTDVVIRALRAAHGIDLQERVHKDMRAHFAAYPANWGLTRPDRNIDHRRVPNLRRYFTRIGAALPQPGPETRFLPGDIVTWTLGPGLPHIGIVSDRRAPGTDRPLILHNVGAGTRLDDFLFTYPMTGHYRLDGKV